ncbi:MAG: urease accessory protein UreD [Afipia sp.]|jgi:urease accessory protein|nr:urease accessory protein UreD [Afipia sp.]
MQLLPQSFSTPHPGREARNRLEADFAGGRTVIRRQHIGYPLHITRGFYMDRAAPDLLTLYLQSASGGLYADDRLHLNVAVRDGASLSLTSQSSTVVHHGREDGSIIHQVLEVGAGAFCSFVNDPYILFPGAHLAVKTIASVAEDAVLLLIDGFTVHDPACEEKSFARFETMLRVVRPDGKLLIVDNGCVVGRDVRPAGGALGGRGAAATLTLIAPREKLPVISKLEEAVTRQGCLAGASSAPNGAGLVMRILGDDAGSLARGMEVAFHVAGAAAKGVELARRRR